jgi:hypothetical protein
VSFLDGTTPLGQGMLSAGVASLCTFNSDRQSRSPTARSIPP